METRLQTEKTRLEEELSRLSHRQASSHGPADDHAGESEDESAAEVAAFSDSLSVETELSRALRDVEKALEAIKKGTYGVCTYCKQDIDERRMRARPTSGSCIECKKTFTQEV